MRFLQLYILSTLICFEFEGRRGISCSHVKPFERTTTMAGGQKCVHSQDWHGMMRHKVASVTVHHCEVVPGRVHSAHKWQHPQSSSGSHLRRLSWPWSTVVLHAQWLAERLWVQDASFILLNPQPCE